MQQSQSTEISLAGRINIKWTRQPNTVRYLHPRRAVLWWEFQELLVQFATSVKLAELQLKFNVTTKQFVFGTLADRCALHHMTQHITYTLSRK